MLYTLCAYMLNTKAAPTYIQVFTMALYTLHALLLGPGVLSVWLAAATAGGGRDWEKRTLYYHIECLLLASFD